MSVRAILFDHDGTLVKSEDIHFQMWKTVLSKYDVVLSPEYYATHYAGKPTLENATDAVQFFALNVPPQALAQAKFQAIHDYVSKRAFPLMPGARLLIEQLKQQGFRLAIVSGARRYEVEKSIQEHHLNNYFETLVCSDDVQKSKPSPDSYLLALERMALPAKACLAVEDTEHGIRAAAEAHIPVLAIPNTTTALQDFSQATAILPNLASIPGWLHNRERLS